MATLKAVHIGYTGNERDIELGTIESKKTRHGYTTIELSGCWWIGQIPDSTIVAVQVADTQSETDYREARVDETYGDRATIIVDNAAIYYYAGSW